MLLVLVTGITIIAIILNKVYKKKLEQGEAQYKYYIASMPIPMDDLAILDKLITDEFDRYQIMKLAHKQNLYITEAIQTNMIREIFVNVYSSLSDDLVNKLCIIYKKQHLEDLIIQKIQMVVLNYTIEVNGNYKDSKK